MSYRVILLPRAEQQLHESALWWAENRSLDQALRWLDGFQAALRSLTEDPDRHGLARENQLYDFPFPVRQLLYGLSRRATHRALFEVRGEIVYVHAIRHLAQRDLTPDDL